VTARDRYILTVLGAVGLLAALWFLAIGPKRSELSKLNAKVEQSEKTTQSAQQNAKEFAQARVSFPRAYADVVRLGKAVPADPDVPSLLVQLEHAADAAGVDFRKVELKGGEEGETGAPPPPAQPAPQAGASGSGEGAAPPAGQGATPPAGQSGAPGASGAPAPPASGTPAPAPGTSAPAAPAASPAPADAVAAATQPIGTSIGPAGFPLIQLTLSFEGSFFKMADFVHEVKNLVEQRNKRLLVSGRLISIDGIVFGEGGKGFPKVTATIAATTYLVPSEQGVLAGATAEAPAAGTPSTPAPASGSAPPTAVVSGP
jgi:hypothetical protein